MRDSWLSRFHDWARGYTQDDINAAVRKVENHWTLPPGSIIPFTGREMKALIGERMMPLFWKCREQIISIRSERKA